MIKKITTSLILSLAAAQTAAAQASSIVPTPQTGTGVSKVNLVANLPKATWQQAVASAIQLILGVTGALTIIAFTVGGVMMLTALGNEDKINKGKDIIFWSIIALIIIAVSYAVTIGITQLVLIQPLQ